MSAMWYCEGCHEDHLGNCPRAGGDQALIDVCDMLATQNRRYHALREAVEEAYAELDMFQVRNILRSALEEER